jgi:hypothetical protein
VHTGIFECVLAQFRGPDTMDLDFGLLQQINADMDGFPVRFDDDMDILDLENVLHAPVPGSFQDFAAWLADNSGTMESVRNPESSGANAACRDNPVTLGLQQNPQQHFAASNALDGVPLVSEPNLPISNLQQQHTQQQQQQQPTHFDVMRQNSAHSVPSQPSPGAGHHAHHAPPTAHDSFRSAHSCNAAGLPEASVLLQQNSPQQQQQQQQMQQQGSSLLASGWGLPSQPQQPQQQQTPQQQAAAASAALSAAANKAQQLLLSPSSGFGAPPAAADVPSTAGFLAAQQPQHGAPMSLALGGASFSTGGFPAISPAVLLSPHGAVLQPVLIGGGGSAVYPSFSVAGMGGMALGPQHMQQGYALHGAHAAAGLALHQSALHSPVGHGVAKHTAMERQQK